MKEVTLKVLQVLSCLISLAIAGWFQAYLGGTEFSGGWLTGPLLGFHAVGGILFTLTLILIFIRARAAAAPGLIASLLCLPLYLYRVAPGLFPGIRSVSPHLTLAWDPAAAFGIFVCVAMVSLVWRMIFVARAVPSL